MSTQRELPTGVCRTELTSKPYNARIRIANQDVFLPYRETVSQAADDRKLALERKEQLIAEHGMEFLAKKSHPELRQMLGFPLTSTRGTITPKFQSGRWVVRTCVGTRELDLSDAMLEREKWAAEELAELVQQRRKVLYKVTTQEQRARIPVEGPNGLLHALTGGRIQTQSKR